MFGYAGRILHVDLGSGRRHTEELEKLRSLGLGDVGGVLGGASRA
ncbi:MAG TPA: hypothetical protein VLD61_09265 [Methylomirabilota bacterium]|nr:hypothetical protein [Methylomirabilota bacterium]